MNKIKLFVLAAIVMLTAGRAAAQKTGYISVDEVVRLMPDLAKIDTQLQRYQADSINAEFQSLVAQYNYKDSLLTKTDTSKMPVAVRNQNRQDLQGLIYQIQNWQGISQQAMQAKQQELLEPVYRKVIATINTVAKENGYAFVYTKDALLVAPPADDLLPLVAKRLNIKLPAGNGVAGPSAPATRPRK
jgi:outer membrane protein